MDAASTRPEAPVSAWIGLGSNLGDREANLRSAACALNGPDVQIYAVSSVYESAAILVEDQPDFLNAVVEVRTWLSPETLLKRCLSVENEMGRVRTKRYGPRVIDLDILLYNSVTVNTPELCIPHRGLLDRAFVMIPLLEIAPEVRLPGGELLRERLRSEMKGDVRLYSPMKTPEA